MTRITELHVNGRPHPVDVEGDRSLLGVLREELGLTGTKYGCGEGQCGACTVLVEGRPRLSCITPVERVEGRPITTIEGLGGDGPLHPVQQAFLEHDALQCGYCTPGMILSVTALLQDTFDPTEEEIVRALDRNLCRCGVYPRIVRAVRAAAKISRERAE
jgi:nicotinate dehydrogenase subunit A